MADRTDLIQQLAASMGTGQYVKSDYESRFNQSTGTLYCDGMTISANIAQQAIDYFTEAKKKCNRLDPTAMKRAEFYQCAIEAIQMVQNPKVKEFLKNEIDKEMNF